MTITGHVWPFETVDAGTVYDHPRNVPQAVGRITFGPRVDADAADHRHVEGDNDNWLTPDEEAEIVADINSGRWPYLLPVAAQAQPARIEDDPAYQEFERLANGQGVNHASPTAPAVWQDRSPIATLRAAGGFIYLGSPYSLYPDHDEAADIVAAAAAGLMAQGIVVYSPIAHGHYVSQQGDLPQTWEFWKAQCQPLIDAASALAVLKMDGWGKSVGLQYEIGEFRRAGKPVVFLDSEAGWREPMDPVEARHDREASRADWEYQFRKEQEAA